jgi:phenylpropionate dioxygenase-like ring-hydroxylating dioxygenase large terminal subunit
MTAKPAARPDWVCAMTNENDFKAEQAALGRLWTFLGFASDIPETNDWFRTTLGGRSIFVQRFEIGIRAFENRCAHRFFPLRTEDKGRGPVVCGFHHWRYNAEGLALGIPKCMEMFGKTPREMDARLPSVEIALCGTMIFGRWPDGPDGSLDDWLGAGRDILAHLVSSPPASNRFERSVAAHWKLLMAISLDDYHIVAVHPTTFGKNGYLPQEIVRYIRFGSHSAYMPGGSEAALEEMAEACRREGYVPKRYRIFQFFPNLIVAQIRATNYLGESYWFVLVQHLIAEAHDRTRSISRFALLPFPAGAPTWRQWARRHALPWIKLGFKYYARKVHIEDNEACETLQEATSLVNGPPILAAQEERVRWFEEEYARHTATVFTDPAGC